MTNTPQHSRSRLSNFFRRAVAFAKGYDVIKDEYSRQRRESYIERGGEDKQLSTEKRNRIINLHRDMLRNAPESVTMDQQVRVNVVGTLGGKLHATFPHDKDASADVIRYFNRRWSKHAEFTRGYHFNDLLKGVLTALATNGDLVLVFDDGILTGGDGTGRIRGFEGDEIANIPQNEFEKRFPKSYKQSEGFVYNESGVFCGCFVSTSQRGRKCFDPSAGFITLRFDPYDEDAVPNWIAIGDMRRFNQGRSVPPATSALTTLIDLHEARGSETQATKLNAQMLGQILSNDDAEPPAPSAFSSPGETTPGKDGDDAADVKTYTLKNLKTIGAKLDEVPNGKKIELFDTKRPNSNFPAFAEYLQGVQGGTRGLARVYSTLKVQNSYTGYRGEQKITELTFKEQQKTLERYICDWCARLVIGRALKLKLITVALPEYWWEYIAWTWPVMPEVSEKEYQQGVSYKLKNGLTSLHRLLAPGEYELLREERRQEAKDAREDGLIYPATESINGALVESPEEGGDGDPDTKDKISDEGRSPSDNNEQTPTEGNN
jgi:capsid protein